MTINKLLHPTYQYTYKYINTVYKAKMMFVQKANIFVLTSLFIVKRHLTILGKLSFNFSVVFRNSSTGFLKDILKKTLLFGF